MPKGKHIIEVEKLWLAKGKCDLFHNKIFVVKGLRPKERRGVVAHEAQHLEDRFFMLAWFLSTPLVCMVAILASADPTMLHLSSAVWLIAGVVLFRTRAVRAQRGG